MKRTIFRGAGVAIATPMFADGSIHYEELARLIDWQIEIIPTPLSSAERPANPRR